jgi:DNA-binding SARP family transcriptional activator/tetratricopeptide (TPR) repeat protein
MPLAGLKAEHSCTAPKLRRVNQSKAAPLDTVDTGIRLTLLQSPQLRVGGTSHLLTPKDAALLALLALDGPTPRAQVAALLWPDAGTDGARNNLRQRVFRLRRLAGQDLVHHRQTLALAPGVVHDLGALPAMLRADATAAAGELLGRFDYTESPALAEWVDTARQQWRAARRDVLAELAAHEERHERIAAALPYAERLARDEPLLEHAQRQLMRLHYRRGDRGAALQVHEQLKTALDQALGETPSAETVQLVTLIEAAVSLPVAPPSQPVAVLRPPCLVGRSEELKALAQARAQGRPVLVLGEAGVGKSRLLGDFCATLGLVLKAAARPGDASVPYTLVSRLLQEVAAAAAGVWAWETWVTAEMARLAPAFGAPAQGRVDRLRLGRAVVSALVALSPSAVILDDLHFADEASLELLPTLLGTGHLPWWLLGSRLDTLPRSVAQWRAAADPGAVLSLELAPLDLPAVAALLASLALPQFAAAPFAERLHRHTGGHPLFLLETLMALGGKAQVSGPGDTELPLPHNMRALIERRLGTLSPRALKLSRIAALAGEDFSVELAARLLDLHPLDLADPWRELEQALVLQGGRFAHDLVQEITRAGVPEPVRCWMHKHIAQALCTPLGRVEPARLALHWREGQQLLPAAEAYHQAAELARAIGQVADECRLLREAATCFTQAAAPRRAFDMLTELTIATREAHGSAQALQVAEELVASATDDQQRAIALKEIGVCQIHAMSYGPASEALAQAVVLAATAGDTNNQNHARYLLALARTHADGAAAGAEVLSALRPWAEAHADASFRHCFGVDLAIMLDQADRRREAVPLFQQAIAFFQRAGEAANLAATHTMLARCLQALGQLAEAVRHGEQALQARISLSGGGGGQGIEALNLGRSLCELGAYGPAITLLQGESERLAAEGTVAPAAAMRLVLARVYFHLAQDSRALQCLNGLPEPLAFHQQALLLWTRALSAPAGPQRQALLDQALGCFAAQDLPGVRLPIALDQVAALEGEAALRRCAALVDECAERDLPAAGMLARASLMGMRHRRGLLEPAHALAQALAGEVPACHPVGLYLPALYAQCRQVALAVGNESLARHSLQTALAWLHGQALPQVPDAFRHSFMHRNPVNRSLLAAAAAG